jgi:uncharacterized membrane protein
LVKSLQAQYILDLIEATVVSLSAGRKNLGMQHFVPALGMTTLDGVYRGRLLGLIISTSFLRLAAVTAMGAISKKLRIME